MAKMSMVGKTTEVMVAEQRKIHALKEASISNRA
jgi:hypothetical protein